MLSPRTKYTSYALLCQVFVLPHLLLIETKIYFLYKYPEVWRHPKGFVSKNEPVAQVKVKEATSAWLPKSGINPLHDL